MRDYFGTQHLLQGSILPIAGAVISIGALFAVNIRGYLSVLPSGMMATIGSDFVFNHSLQFSMAVAMASLLGWQFGDIAFLASNYLIRLKNKMKSGRFNWQVLLFILSFEFLGAAKQLTFRYFFGLLSFCYIFSGFQILISLIFIVELLLVWFVVATYLEHRHSDAEPLPLLAYADRLVEDVARTNWKEFKLSGVVPIAVFFSLFFSHELGEERAKQVLDSEPVYLAKQDLNATAFASSGIGTVFAVWHADGGEKQKQKFILIGNSGEEIMRSW